MPEQYEPDSGKTKTSQSIAVYDGSNPAYFKNWHAKVLSHYATWLNGEERAGHWKQHLVSDGCFIDMPSSELDDKYLKLFRSHLASDKLNTNIRSHRHAESCFRHARDERIAEWQNRQRVLFADVQKFLDGTALTDTLLEYDNARDKEIDQLRNTIADEAVRDTLIEKAKQDNPYRLWQAIENTLGAKKVTDIKVLKNQIDFGIVDHTNHHGISKGYTAEAYIRAWEQKLKDLRDALPPEQHATCHYFNDEYRTGRLEAFFRASRERAAVNQEFAGRQARLRI